jgi:hypothetical protein
MPKMHIKFAVLALIAQTAWIGTSAHAQISEHPTYASMAPIQQYLMPDEHAELALARSAAPPSISQAAEVMVLGAKGYATAAKGSNGFVCLVERGWGAATDNPEFWNPKVRSPVCFNPAAARSYLPTYLLKTNLVLAGTSRADIPKAITAAFGRKQLPALAPGAMCYMLSKQQYLSDQDMRWHPHLMFFVAGDAAKSWGANVPGSPVMAANDPEERLTIMLVWAGQWSDGTPAAASMH